ncbi:TPA: hypothetical protein ACUNF5_005212 [Burkholderia orbicola]
MAFVQRQAVLSDRNPVEFSPSHSRIPYPPMPNFAHFLDTADTLDLPRQAIDLLRTINRDADADRAKLLMQFVASSIHPDYVFNLSMLSVLPAEHKAAVVAYFAMSISGGLTLAQQAIILQVVESYFASGARYGANR